MSPRFKLFLVASHLAAIAFAVTLARRKMPAPAPVPEAVVEAARPPAPRPVSAKVDRPLAEWRSNEFQSAWNAVRTAKFSTLDRVKAQRELLKKWAEIDLDASLRAALAESWAADRQWYGDDYVNESMGPLLDALSGVIAEGPEVAWNTIQGGNFGVATGMLHRLWIVSVAEKDARTVANKLGQFSWRDREQAIISCGVSLMNQRSNLTYPGFLKILLALPPEQVSAEQLRKWGVRVSSNPADAARSLDAILKTDVSDTRMLRFHGLCLGGSLFTKSTDEIAAVTKDLPAVARQETLLSTLRTSGSRLGFQRTTGIADLLIADEAWDVLAKPEITAKLQSATTSEDIGVVATWVTRLPVRKETEALFDRGVEAYLRDNPDTSAEWIGTISSDVWRDRAYTRYADVVLQHHRNPEASRWAVGQIADATLKKEAESRLALWQTSSTK